MLRILVVGAMLAALGTAAAGQETATAVIDSASVDLDNREIFDHSLKALMILFVLAVLIENALAILFNWRIFLAYFSLKGWRTPIAVLVSWIVVGAGDLDVVGSLIDTYAPPEPAGESGSSAFTGFLTALILAGGSGGVHRIMTTLGYRSSNRADELLPKPRNDRAWVSVRVDRENAVGDVQVLVAKLDDGAGGDATRQLAGTLQEDTRPLNELLFRVKDRFPQNGGYELVAEAPYRISIIARDRDGKLIDDPFDGDVFHFAPRAIIDFRKTL